MQRQVVSWLATRIAMRNHRRTVIAVSGKTQAHDSHTGGPQYTLAQRLWEIGTSSGTLEAAALNGPSHSQTKHMHSLMFISHTLRYFVFLCNETSLHFPPCSLLNRGGYFPIVYGTTRLEWGYEPQG